MPMNLSWGPLWGPVSGRPMTCAHSIDETDAFDFRSYQFGVNARTLARATGRCLVSCRQELFIAEGDMGLAYVVLIAGYGAEPDHPTLH